jgi:hypothetical protein
VHVDDKSAVAIYDAHSMPVVALLSADAFCSDAQLAAVCGLSARHVQRLTAERVLRKGKRGYRLSASVQAYLRYREEWIKRECSKTDNGYNEARTARIRSLMRFVGLAAEPSTNRFTLCMSISRMPQPGWPFRLTKRERMAPSAIKL